MAPWPSPSVLCSWPWQRPPSLTIPQTLIHVYTHDRQTVAVGARLLAVAAVFQVFDAIQGVGTGALRGLGKTRGPMLINLVAYGIIGLPIGYPLFQDPTGLLRPVERPDTGTHFCRCAGPLHVAETVESDLNLPEWQAIPVTNCACGEPCKPVPLNQCAVQPS
jgi:hypothetical protein